MHRIKSTKCCLINKKYIADSVFDLVVGAKSMPNLVPGSKINFLSCLEGFIKTYEQNRATTFNQLTVGSMYQFSSFSSTAVVTLISKFTAQWTVNEVTKNNPWKDPEGSLQLLRGLQKLYR